MASIVVGQNTYRKKNVKILAPPLVCLRQDGVNASPARRTASANSLLAQATSAVQAALKMIKGEPEETDVWVPFAPKPKSYFAQSYWVTQHVT